MWRTDGASLPGIYLYKKMWNKDRVRAHVFASRTWLTDSRGKERLPFLDASHFDFVGPLK